MDINKKIKRLKSVARLHSISIQSRMLNCGRHCARCPHGIYYFAKWREGSKTISLYLGKELPDEVRPLLHRTRKSHAV